MLDKNARNRLNMREKKSSGYFENIVNKMCLQIIYI